MTRNLINAVTTTTTTTKTNHLLAVTSIYGQHGKCNENETKKLHSTRWSRNTLYLILLKFIKS